MLDAVLRELRTHALLGNTLGEYAAALSLLAGSLTAIFAGERFVVRRLVRWASVRGASLDDMALDVVRWAFFPMLAVGAVVLSLRGLEVHASLERIVSLAWTACLTVFGIRLGFGILIFLLRERWVGGRAAQAGALKTLTPVLKASLWGLGAIFFLDNAGVKVGAVVAGLGIGGVALALASQTILGDVFSHVAILFDRPFTVGDFIVVDDLMGTVEQIGIKTTRVKSLSGELLVVPNSSLTASRIRNFQNMTRRRAVFRFGLVYEIPIEKLKAVPGEVRRIISETPDTEFDRAHFASFGESSLDFEAVYHVLTADYNRYMDVQQQINFRIMEVFQEQGLSFAYPTRTIHAVPARP